MHFQNVRESFSVVFDAFRFSQSHSSPVIDDFRLIVYWKWQSWGNTAGPTRFGLLGRSCHGRITANHRLGETLHFFKLRAELEQHEVDPGGFELGDALGDLLGRADKSGAQATVRNGVIFQGNALLELGSRQPLLVICITCGGLLYVGDASKLVPRFALRFSNDSVARDTELQRRKFVTAAP